ncbi:hypothetical protein HZB02_04950 [Candidatus Woesearchaeota archaeon]|nr:hypothetical protein [Candidatus Woesearchaeota archaeon]
MLERRTFLIFIVMGIGFFLIGALVGGIIWSKSIISVYKPVMAQKDTQKLLNSSSEAASSSPSPTCLSDNACPSNAICKRGNCVTLTCDVTTSYIENHQCLPYPCLSDAACKENEICMHSKAGCTVLNCKPGTQPSNHQCIKIPPPPLSCGNGICDKEENAATCREDCAYAYDTNAYTIAPIYITPGYRSSSSDVKRRIALYERILSNKTLRSYLSDERIASYQKDLAFWMAWKPGDKLRDEPVDGSSFAGVAGEDKVVLIKADKIRELNNKVKEFYDYHTGRSLTIEPLRVVVGNHSPMYYWDPKIHDGSIDQDPLPNTVMDELQMRGVLPQDYQGDHVIEVYIVEMAGGWAGAGQSTTFGGDGLFGDIITSCLNHPKDPNTQYEEDRLAWPDHLCGYDPATKKCMAWQQCTYSFAAGTYIHELGHTLGLPHPAEFGCPNLGGSLVMQSHWNVDFTLPGFFKRQASGSNNFGILKDSRECSDPNHANGFGYTSKEGISTPARSDGHFHTELEILRNNPHFT